MKITELTTERISELVELLVKIDGETDFLYFAGTERSTNLLKYQNWFSSGKKRGDIFLLVDDTDGVPLAYIIGERSSQPKKAHTMTLSSGVLKDHHNQGIGRLMLGGFEKRARAAGILRLQAFVRSDNHACLHVLLANGFQREGALKGSILQNDQELDEIVLSKRA